MTRDEALTILRKVKPLLEKQYGVSSMILFGSVARDEAQPQSDVDVFVRAADMGLYELIGLAESLEESLGCKVDVVTDHAGLRPFFRQRLARDGVHV